MSSYYNRVKFTATTTGTTDFGVGSVSVGGFQTPATASVPNNQPVSYAAFSADGTQWETGRGLYVSSGPTVTRVTVFDTSGAFGSKVSFTLSPTVQLDLLAQDIFPDTFTPTYAI